MRPPSKPKAPLILEVLEDRFLLAAVAPVVSTSNVYGNTPTSQITSATNPTTGQNGPQGGNGSSQSNPYNSGSNYPEGVDGDASSGSSKTPSNSNQGPNASQGSNTTPEYGNPQYGWSYSDQTGQNSGKSYNYPSTDHSPSTVASATLQPSTNEVQAVVKAQALSMPTPASGSSPPADLMVPVSGASGAAPGGTVVTGPTGPGDIRIAQQLLGADSPTEDPALIDKLDADNPGDRLIEEQPGSPSGQNLADLVLGPGSILGGTLPVDWSALFLGADQFFARLESLGQDVFPSPLLERLAPWLVLTAVAPLTLEMLGWRLKKPGEPRWEFWSRLLVPLPRGHS